MRMIVEKPFGRDHDPAVELAEVLVMNLQEPEIYRVDH
jgi:glucose-6-phosphate 1-dehydrogenase